jgi:hypothetical protein
MAREFPELALARIPNVRRRSVDLKSRSRTNVEVVPAFGSGNLCRFEAQQKGCLFCPDTLLCNLEVA